MQTPLSLLILPVIKKKTLSVSIFFVLQVFFLDAYGSSEKVDEKINSKYKMEKKYFPTTNVKGSLFFTLGALSESTSSESLHFTYENKIRLNTSFKGTDNLLTVFESGNALDSPLILDLQSKKGDTLKISTLLYKFQLDDEYEAIIGPKMFGYHGLAGKSTAYNERIAILDGSNYSTSSGIGPGIGISKREKNGLNASFKIASDSSQIDSESIHFINQIGLTKKDFGGTITTNLNNDFEAYGIATFYKRNNFPSISASIEYKDMDSGKTIKNWVFALQQGLQNKKIGIAVGTHNLEEKIGYEGWSEINISDNLKIIPVFFVRETNQVNPELGLSINTKFSY